MQTLRDTFPLGNGGVIPCIGFGTWQAEEGQAAIRATGCALEAGYRHIDTAAAYGNEESVGAAILQSGIDRGELFVTSKVWATERGYEKTGAAFEQTMEKLGLDYLDLYLIHWPASHTRFSDWEEINLETWRAMTQLYQEGRIRAIGVSNFLPHHLKALLNTSVPPMVNQIEFHPGELQTETVALCRAHNILVEGWSPLGRGRLLTDPRLTEIAAKYGKSVAQLCIRFCLQHGVLPLPKSVTPGRIRENADVFDFVISEEDMGLINALPNLGGSGLHPDTVTF